MSVNHRDPNTGVLTPVAGNGMPSGIGTAATKDFVDVVRQGNHDLVESNAVYNAINQALSSIYTPRGDIACADLTSSLLVDANVGNVYETSDSGTTTALFIQGAGHPIVAGDNVGIIKAGQNTVLFNLMGNAFDLHDYQKKDLESAIEGQATVEGALNALSTNKATQAEVNDMNNVLGAKNLLPFNLSHIQKVNGGGTWNGNVYTYRDITYTINTDGTITVNGTANGDSIFRVLDNASLDFSLNPNKTYCYNGSPTSGSSASTYYSYYSELIGGAWTYFMSYGASDTSVTPNASATQIVVDIFVKSGKTINNQVFKPMIRLASDPDNTYEPYSMTNQQITPYVQAISNPNLLDNPWFTVNQRAKSSYSGPNYAVDRWEVLNNKGTVTVNADGSITVTASGGDTWLRQKFDPELLKKLVGKTITVSIDAVKTGGNVNLYSGYYDASNTWHRISEDVAVKTSRTIVSRTAIVSTLEGGEPKFGEFGIYIQSGQSVTIYSTKLEIGTVSTLAMDTAPNYATELLKCQRYFVRYLSSGNNSGIATGGFSGATIKFFGLIHLPTTMREAPTLTYSGTFNLYSYTSKHNITPNEITVLRFMNNIVKITATFTNTTLANDGDFGELQLQTGAYIDFSADL